MRDLLSLSLEIDILIKAVDSASYHAILQELKDKEIYNMIVDIHNTDNMADFLRAVSIRTQPHTHARNTCVMSDREKIAYLIYFIMWTNESEIVWDVINKGQ